MISNLMVSSLFRTSLSPILNLVHFKLLGSQTLARFPAVNGLMILVVLSILDPSDAATAANPDAWLPSRHLTVWGLVGLGGIVYAVIVARRLSVQTIYQPVV